MAELGSDIGTTLRETRMRARIDIGEVEMRTKIRAKYLRAMENEEWDLLPGPVYVKSFLRTYGDYLGLDSRLLVDEYKRRYELSSDVHGRPLASVKRERERERQRAVRGPRIPRVPSWAFIVLILIAAGAGLYLFGSSGSSSPRTPSNLASAGSRVTPAVSHRGSGPRRRPAGSGRSATSTTGAGTGTATDPTSVATRATFRVVPTADVWVCVENAKGKPVIIGGQDYAPGQTVPTASGSTLLVALGNDQADIFVDGKPYHPAAGGSISLKITPHGATALAPSPDCGV